MNKELERIFKELNARPIAYFPIYRKLTGSTTAGILLSQLMYWFSMKDKFYKTDAELIDETYLGSKELRTAKLIIKNLEFIKITKEGIPATTYYEINWDLFYEALSNINGVQTSLTESVKQERPNRSNKNDQNGQTISNNTSNTTHNKEENNKKKKQKLEMFKNGKILYSYNIRTLEPTYLSENEIDSPNKELIIMRMKEIYEFAPRVASMDKPMSFKNYEQLLTKYTDEQIRKTIMKMQNWKPLLKKNEDAHLTVIAWLEK